MHYIFTIKGVTVESVADGKGSARQVAMVAWRVYIYIPLEKLPSDI